MTSIAVKFTPTGGVIHPIMSGLQQTSSPITLKNTIQSDAGRRLDAMLDVTADTAETAAGSTLVYDPATDKYIVKLLDLDGGRF